MAMKLAVIGLDTSHAVAFTNLIQGKEAMVSGLRVVNCLRFPSAFQSEPDQDKRQAALEELGVRVTRSLEEAVRGVEGILLEINDPALHLDYFQQVADLGLPVFLDKPMADTLAHGKAIYQLAREKDVSVWSASSLRFTPEIMACAAAVEQPTFCNVFGALGKAARGSSVVWYGIHAFEMLAKLMGRGARSVFAREDESGVVAIVQYGEGRRGVVECNRGAYRYGGSARKGELTESFLSLGSPYPSLIKALETFFLEGEIPVPLQETLEIQAMLEAAEASLRSGQSEPVSAA
jgi:predicted dehydrogenase